ncbi:MAG: hypothetical protein IT337_17905 [Thermomicrobiales bacterium]|nr:hypothetical protein [Thermomicrobiales bacterium]
MDDKTFDGLTRGLGRDCTRRAAMKGLVAAAAGFGVVARGAAAQVEAEKCGGKNDKCFRNSDCCKGLKCNNNKKSGDPGVCKQKNKNKKGGQGDYCEQNNDCKKGYKCKRNKNKCKRKN